MESKELTVTNEKPQVLPLLPLKNAVLFPGLMMPLSVGRAASLAAIEAALATEGKEIVVVAQRDASIQEPRTDHLYTIGTRAAVRTVSKGDQHMDVLVVGLERVVVLKIEEFEPYLRVRVRPLPLPDDASREIEALSLALVDLAQRMLQLMNSGQEAPELARMLASNSEDPLRMAFVLATMFSLPPEREQRLLECQTRVDALRELHAWLSHEVEVFELRNKINSQARSEMSKEQKEYMLRQQMRAIQQELGERNPDQVEVEQLRERIAKADLPEEVRKEAERELARLEKMPSGQPEFNVVRTWLEYVADLPWKIYTQDNLDIRRARQVLDEDHFGLKDVKDRILEQLAVLKMNPEAKAPILCFVGPPGVGKTSLGQSIARALGRKFERMSLGGMHDEAELRGHRRTYIGALPGRLIQAMRRAGAGNPVIMLDEVDKLGRDFRGDPAAALLEILDPEQNKTFRDNYLDLPFDLSKVMFITTANSLDSIPGPLLDRMEVMRLPGYSREEKAEIARRYLIPRQLKQTGLRPDQFQLLDDGLHKVIADYTREAGVRRLEQAIGRLARKVALDFALRMEEGQEPSPVVLDAAKVAELLGPERFSLEDIRRELQPGEATGLAWTENGGEVLYIESTLLPEGKGLTLTGQLGEVMQESAKIAQTWVWSHAADLGIDPAQFRDQGLHIHVPAGAIPKDGPSAGITMVTALASLYTKVAPRSDTAMTGEVTLSGLVLPIGGVKEKVLAARRAGLRRVLLPKANQKDLRDLPDDVRNEMEFVFVERVYDVLLDMLPGLSIPTQRAA